MESALEEIDELKKAASDDDDDNVDELGTNSRSKRNSAGSSAVEIARGDKEINDIKFAMFTNMMVVDLYQTNCTMSYSTAITLLALLVCLFVCLLGYFRTRAIYSYAEIEATSDLSERRDEGLVAGLAG